MKNMPKEEKNLSNSSFMSMRWNDKKNSTGYNPFKGSLTGDF
jgi:hypothetical protein